MVKQQSALFSERDKILAEKHGKLCNTIPGSNGKPNTKKNKCKQIENKFG